MRRLGGSCVPLGGASRGNVHKLKILVASSAVLTVVIRGSQLVRIASGDSDGR
jgi:hypothetical protein